MNTAQLFTGKKIPLAPGIAFSAVTGSQLMVAHLRFAAGAEGAIHSHPHEQITLVLSGEVTFTLGSERMRLHAGDAVTIPADTPHGLLAQTVAEVLDIFTPVREDLLSKLSS